jgi:hypothetical protein
VRRPLILDAGVAAGLAGHPVVTRPAAHRVAARATQQDVVAATTEQDFVAPPRPQITS